MRRIVFALTASVLLSGCLLLPAATGDGFRWRVEPAGELSRPDEPGSLSMGGIAWISNNVYWAVTDWHPVVWELELPVDPASGKPQACRLRKLFSPGGALDVEGLVRDPLDGSIWLADERAGRIRRYDSVTGRGAEVIKLPPPMQDFYRDSGFESLTISSDGLTLWTCMEEALVPDGLRATRTQGTDVRLVRFVRKSAKDAWTVSGQWVYRTDTIAGGPWFNRKKLDLSRCGISELCLLEDGTLLVLEREFSKVLIPRFRCRLYETDFSSATDVQGLSSISNAPSLKKVEKKMLFETTGLSMYEGLCLGPKLSDGARLLVMVSDGEKKAFRSVMTLRLYPLAR